MQRRSMILIQVTGSDSGPGKEEGLGSGAEEKKRVKAEKKEQ